MERQHACLPRSWKNKHTWLPKSWKNNMQDYPDWEARTWIPTKTIITEANCETQTRSLPLIGRGARWWKNKKPTRSSRKNKRAHPDRERYKKAALTGGWFIRNASRLSTRAVWLELYVSGRGGTAGTDPSSETGCCNWRASDKTARLASMLSSKVSSNDLTKNTQGRQLLIISNWFIPNICTCKNLRVSEWNQQGHYSPFQSQNDTRFSVVQ